jgi:membrane-associated phospholipid phosphatase
MAKPENFAGPKSPARRRFLRGIGAAGAATITAAATGIDWLRPRAAAGAQSDFETNFNSKAAVGLDGDGDSAAEIRRDQAFTLRMQAANAEKRVPLPPHLTNGDEARYTNSIGDYSKGLPHNSLGEVDATAYAALVKAATTGDPDDFDAIPLGGTVPLVDPQAGLAFDIEGTDSHQLEIPAAPALASAERAGEAVEVYWQALLRDLPFSQYGSLAAAAAIKDLNALSDFRGPRAGGKVTAGTLFRGFTSGDLIGPYISQFFFPTLQYGAAEVVQQYLTYLPLGGGGADYLIDFASWLKVQNGQGPFGSNALDSQRRYLRCGRDLAAYVHIDVLFEAYFNACIFLIDAGAPLNPGNPYRSSPNQTGFGTFGAPHIKTLVAEVATRALKAVWYQKWMVHRALRPEEYGGLVHLTKMGVKSYPVHADMLNSKAMQQVFSRNGTYLLPMAFPEGCPQHPSYGAGHATVAGACSTIVKAFFDETWVIPDPQMASDDGLSLLPYTGSDAGQITLGGEMNKIAANVAIGRNHAGVHWRSDYAESLLLGEAVAISVLRDSRKMYNENFSGFTFTMFDGTPITV